MLATALIVFFFVIPVALALISGIMVARLGMLGGAIVGLACLLLGTTMPLWGVPLIVGLVGGTLFRLVVRR